MKRIVSILFIIVLFLTLAACGAPTSEPEGSTEPTTTPSATPEATTPSETETPSTPEPEPYTPMDIFSDEFNPFGANWSGFFTVFEASFEKGSAILDGKARFVLSMTGSDDMFACVAYQADIAGLSDDEKNERINEYLEDGFCQFVGTDGRMVGIRQATLDDGRYEYVTADGSHGQTGGGCAIDIAYYIDEADVEKYTLLVRDSYNLDALSPFADYFSIETDFNECSINVNLYTNTVRTNVVFYVPDIEETRQSIAANFESDWWEFSGNIETYIPYDDTVGNKLIFNTDASAITVVQERKAFGAASSEGNYSALGFGFDEAGVCGVYEEHEPFYSSVAVAKPEWGEFANDWNMEFNDSNVNGYSVVMWYYANDNRYEIQIDRDNASSKYSYFPEGELDFCYPDTDTVRQMFNAAFGTEGDSFYHAPFEHFEQYVQERFRLSVDELYALPKQ